MRKKRTAFLLLTVVAAFLTPASLYAETKVWKWKDEKGGIHYADDFSKVPAEFKEKAKSQLIISPPSPKTSEKKEPVRAPYPPPRKKAEEPAKEIDSKTLSALKDMIEHLKGEVERDAEIIEMVSNIIAFSKFRELLKRDLPIKKKLLKALKEIENADLNKEIEGISKNIELETRIIETMLIGKYSARKSRLFRKSKNQIRKALSEKKKLVQDLSNAKK